MVRVVRVTPARSREAADGAVRPEDEGPSFGVVDGDAVRLLAGHPFGTPAPTGTVLPTDGVRLLAPIIPSKVLCIGRNYADHASELGNPVPPEPMVFLKPSTAVVGPGAAIRLPALAEVVHHEAELAVVIGRLTRKVSPTEALGAVYGYTCANDVSARDLQRRDGQWARAKGFDSFCPLGPWIETELDPAAGVAVRCRVNGELRQDGNTADWIFGLGEMIAHCAAFTTLLPGDVLLTGTPAGVGPLGDGDTVDVEVDGIGTLSNPVVAED